MSMDKKELRRVVRERLSSVADSEREARSALLCKSLLNTLSEYEGGVVALYSPLPDEVQVWPLITAISLSCTVVLPRVEGDTMRFFTYSEHSMEKGAYGILEPVNGRCVAPSEIDAIVVPGVAFTEEGARMGRGKGYYDKYMSQPGFRAVKIGLCFKEQLLGSLPVEEHDIFMDFVVAG